MGWSQPTSYAWEAQPCSRASQHRNALQARDHGGRLQHAHQRKGLATTQTKTSRWPRKWHRRCPRLGHSMTAEPTTPHALAPYQVQMIQEVLAAPPGAIYRVQWPVG